MVPVGVTRETVAEVVAELSGSGGVDVAPMLEQVTPAQWRTSRCGW